MEQKAREFGGVWVNLIIEVIEFVCVQNVGCVFFSVFSGRSTPCSYQMCSEILPRYFQDNHIDDFNSTWYLIHDMFFVSYPPFTRCPSNGTCKKHPLQINDFVTWLREKHSTKIEATKDDGGQQHLRSRSGGRF